jgi:hypothetical protein
MTASGLPAGVFSDCYVTERELALAASLGADRFLREIAMAARLSHPHIRRCMTPAKPRGGSTTQCLNGGRYGSHFTRRSANDDRGAR